MLYYYIITFISASLASWKANRNKVAKGVLTLLLVVVPMALLNMLRDYYVGADTYMYTTGWALPEINDSTLSDIYQNGRWEIGFAILCKMCLLTSNPRRCLLVISGLMIFIFLTIAAFSVSDNPALFFFLYILSGEFYASMNTMRQAIAIAISAIAFIFFKRNNKLLYVITIVVASMFHKSVLVLLLLLVIGWLMKRKSIQLTAFFVVIMCVVMLVMPNSLYSQFLGATGYDNYINNDAYATSGHVAPLLYLLCFLCWGWSWLIGNRREGNERECVSMLVLGIILCIAGIKSAIMFRLIDYCFVGICLYSCYFRASRIDRQSNIYANILFYAPFLGLYCFTSYLVPTWTRVFPYILGTDLFV